jgi:hypothetical protein
MNTMKNDDEHKQEQIDVRFDMVYLTLKLMFFVKNTKINVNYKIVILYNYQNTFIFLYYSLIYYHITLIKKVI